MRWAYTSARYSDPFDLEKIAEDVGYPLYMKRFDGGGWRGVSPVDDVEALHRSYDESGNMLMHLQATVDYEHFPRVLSIGLETMVMGFRPGEPMHSRYAVTHNFLSARARVGDADGEQGGQRVLRLGVQQLRDAHQGRGRAPDRLRQRLAPTWG